jgi:cell division protein FtsZ
MKNNNLPENKASKIKVFGLGAWGCSTVNFMYKQGIIGTDFIIGSSDSEVLDKYSVPKKIFFDNRLEVNLNSTEEKQISPDNEEKIKLMLGNDTQILFIIGTLGNTDGCAALIAKMAKETKIEGDIRENSLLSIGFFSLPFDTIIYKPIRSSDEELKETRKYIDSVLICKSKHFLDPFPESNEESTMKLLKAIKGISLIVNTNSFINIDLVDIYTIMKNKGGVAFIGFGSGNGENRAIIAIEEALYSHNFKYRSIKGTRSILLYFMYSKPYELTMVEVQKVTDFIVKTTGTFIDIIWGAGEDNGLGDKLVITFLAGDYTDSEEKIYALYRKYDYLY